MVVGTQNREYLDFFNSILSLDMALSDVKMITELGQDNQPKAVAVFSNCSQYNMEISIASADTWKSSRQFIKECANYAFNTCGIERLTVIVRENNAKSLKFCKRLGFAREFESTLKRWFGSVDGVQMVMFKDQCKWIKG